MSEFKLSREEQKAVIRGNAAIHKRLTPRRAIREHCIDCVGGAHDVKNCQGDELYDGPCIFFPYRMGRGRPSVRLIRKFCLYCMGGSEKLVRECPSKTCQFLRYRMGRNPSIKGTMSEGMVKHRFKSRERPLCPVNLEPESTQTLARDQNLSGD